MQSFKRLPLLLLLLATFGVVSAFADMPRSQIEMHEPYTFLGHRVRSDIAYHETPNGGGCFAFSSIAFCGSLPWNGGKNNISKLVGNVLNRFMQDGPLLPPPKSAIKHRGRADYDPPLNKKRK